jgi:hypothetical protein
MDIKTQVIQEYLETGVGYRKLAVKYGKVYQEITTSKNLLLRKTLSRKKLRIYETNNFGNSVFNLYK